MTAPAERAAPRLLLIDNYDSFTYNLVQAFLVIGADVRVHRNDQITVDEARALAPTHLCISPGPGTPDDAGVSKDMIRAFAGRIPVLGVCLGHQALIEVYGGEIVRAERLMHGKTSKVEHDGRGILAALPNPFSAGRYHSLIARMDSVPDVFEVTAWTAEKEVMGVRHKTLAIEGVQFHPESILTPDGPKLLEAFFAAEVVRAGTRMQSWRIHKSCIDDVTEGWSLLDEGGQALTRADVFSNWSASKSFRQFWSAGLRDVAFDSYCWECPPVTTTDLWMPFECVFVESPLLARLPPDPSPFSEYFGGNCEVATFESLGRDALLIAPCPVGGGANFSHLASFVATASESRQDALWSAVGQALEKRISAAPLWLSTAGLGVSWLHVRLDSQPKYYRHAPYQHATSQR